MQGFAKCLLQEVREYNIKVSCICPGMVNTGMGSDITRGIGEHLVHITPDEMIQVFLLSFSYFIILQRNILC